jgi:hypothetical protein
MYVENETISLISFKQILFMMPVLKISTRTVHVYACLVFNTTEEDNAARVCDTVIVVFISLWKLSSLYICWT